MTNSGIIEGHTEYSGCSDLNLATSPCQSVPNPTMNVGDPWATIGRAANLPNGSMRVFHGAGTTDEEIAGQHSNKATTVLWIAGSGGGKGLWPATALKQMLPHYRRNPLSLYVEKEARLRPQHLFTFRSEATRHANVKPAIAREAVVGCAPPLLNTL